MLEKLNYKLVVNGIWGRVYRRKTKECYYDIVINNTNKSVSKTYNDHILSDIPSNFTFDEIKAINEIIKNK